MLNYFSRQLGNFFNYAYIYRCMGIFLAIFLFSSFVRLFVLTSVPDLLVSSSSKADLQMINSTSCNRGIRFDTEFLLTW